MPITGNVRTFYEDSSHTIAVWPRTSMSAVTDSEGRTVQTLIAGKQDTISDLSDIRSKANSALQDGDNISGLTNDSGYVTDAYHDATKQNLLTVATVTLPTTGWTLDSTNNVYYQDFAVSGMTTTSYPWIDLSLTGTGTAMSTALEEYKKILTVYTFTDTIRVVASSALTNSIDIIVKR